jgi:peptidyl-tRNA hydrolase, PTH1 family
MKLIVGLGNPGEKYKNTRHNMGFLVLDALAKKWEVSGWKTNFNCEYLLVKEKDVILAKPQTFMNLSGTPTQSIAQYFKITIEDIIVIYDDLALNPGKIRLRYKGSSGSHNGIQHVMDVLNTEEIKRIRVGIGSVPTVMQGKDYVLQPPTKHEKEAIEEGIRSAVSAAEYALGNSFVDTMNKFNRGDSD